MALLVLYVMLVIYSVNATANQYLRYVVKISSYGCVIWGVFLAIVVYISENNKDSHDSQNSQNSQNNNK